MTKPKEQLLDEFKNQRLQSTKSARRVGFEIGQLLAECKNVNPHELGLSARTLKNYKAFFKIMTRLKAEHLVEYVEPSKLCHFYEVLNEENIETVIQFCATHSEREIERIAKSFPLLAILNKKKRLGENRTTNGSINWNWKESDMAGATK